jgi:hypothetical protein
MRTKEVGMIIPHQLRINWVVWVGLCGAWVVSASAQELPGPEECVTRTQGFYGASPKGHTVLSFNQSKPLQLVAFTDPLLVIFTGPSGTLLPVALGNGAFTFGTVSSITGSTTRSANDGGFLPGKSYIKSTLQNILAHQALTVALNAGLGLVVRDPGPPLVGASTLDQIDTNGDGEADSDLYYSPHLRCAIVNNGAQVFPGDDGMPGTLDDVIPPATPSGFGNGLTVQQVLLMANSVVAQGGANADPGTPLSAYGLDLSSQLDPSKTATLGELIEILGFVNEACPFPDAPPSGFLVPGPACVAEPPPDPS